MGIKQHEKRVVMAWKTTFISQKLLSRVWSTHPHRGQTDYRRELASSVRCAANCELYIHKRREVNHELCMDQRDLAMFTRMWQSMATRGVEDADWTALSHKGKYTVRELLFHFNSIVYSNSASSSFPLLVSVILVFLSLHLSSHFFLLSLSLSMDLSMHQANLRWLE